MGGGTDLQWLLSNLEPVRRPGVFVFCTFPNGNIPPVVEPVATVQEEEGLTCVIERSAAQRHKLRGEFPCTWITLKVHSDLAAVGLTAAVSAALARAGIACNMVAGYHHDHLFVPCEKADRVMDILISLAAAETGS